LPRLHEKARGLNHANWLRVFLACWLGIGPNTVRQYVWRMMDALGVHRTRLVIWAPAARAGHLLRRMAAAAAAIHTVRQAEAAIGLDASAFGSHSLRAGFVTEAGEDGASELRIEAQTGHRDIATLRRISGIAGI